MDKVTQAIEWSQKRLELRDKKLTEEQLEVLNFAFHNVREELNKLQKLTITSSFCQCKVNRIIVRHEDKDWCNICGELVKQN